KKIRTASKHKAPFVLIAGGEDAEASAVSIRDRAGSQDNGAPIDEANDSIVTALQRRQQVYNIMANRTAAHDEALTDDIAVPGVPDAFDRLWTPHRMAYVAKGQSQVTDEASCPFCTAPQRDDETSLIVARGETCYVVMNLYPYNPGHLLVCPYRHVPDYT